MATMKLPPVDVLRNLLDCDPETGRLQFRARPRSMFNSDRAMNAWNAKHAGKVAATSCHVHGYAIIGLLGRVYPAHRVIWTLVHGYEPPQDIDHINGHRSDNRPVNLRAVTRSENGKNQKLHVTNKSGFSGVTWCRRNEAWAARITVEGRRKHLGYHSDFALAVKARKAAEVVHGFHENHGKVRPGY
jgi:HNH endonuclease